MQRLLISGFLAVILVVSVAGANAATSQKRRDTEDLAALEAQCQAAREKILNAERAKYIEECVQGRSRRSREECERFYADHGNPTFARGPLYLNLPECVEAHNFRQNRSR